LNREVAVKKQLAIFGILSLASGCMGGAGNACGGCISSKIQEEVEKQTGVDLESQEDFSDYKLTDKDLEKMLKDLPVVAKDFKEMDDLVNSTPEPGQPIASFGASQALLDKLETMGWKPPQKFFVVYGLTMTAYAYLQLQEGLLSEGPGDMGEAIASMEQMLDDPNIPEPQKREIRKQIKEMEKAQKEMKSQASEIEDDPQMKQAIAVVKRHRDDIEKTVEKMSK